jgi:hypothetical protein
VPCAGECSICNELGTCTACFKDDTVFAEGRCLEECPVLTTLVDGVCQRDEQTSTQDEADGENSFFLDELAMSLDACEVTNCQSCGLSGAYCQKCQDDFVLLKDGTCSSECEAGSFKVDSKCYKCSPVCKICEGTAN